MVRMIMQNEPDDEWKEPDDECDDAESDHDDVQILETKPVETVDEPDAQSKSASVSDDYAHRGDALHSMPFYVYRMYVRRVRRTKALAKQPNVFCFEDHYQMWQQYVQLVRLDNMDVPTIDGFQCPTWTQDAEQNCLLKALLFTPWRCRDALTCGTCKNFSHMLSNCTCEDHSAAQPVVTVTPSRLPPGYDNAQPVVRSLPERKHTFERAWRLRCSELHVLARRAEARSQASRKMLVLADSTLFATIKEPAKEIKDG